MEAASVEIKLVISLAGGEEQVDAPVIVKIAGADASAVVEIHIVEDVKAGGGVQRIAEIQAG